MTNETLDKISTLEKQFKADNLRAFRTFLHLSQKEFIERYFTGGGQRLISISKLSMAEHGNLSDIDPLLRRLADLCHMPVEQFALPPEKFTKNLFRFTPDSVTFGAVRGLQERQQSYFETVVKMISNYLADNILYGRMKPGDKLPSERELVKIFHIKRPALRDAVKVLVVLGLLDVRQGDGTYISATPTDFYATPLSWNLIIGAGSTAEVIDLRFLLDEEAAKKAILNATPTDLMELNNVFLQMQTAYDTQDIQKYLTLDMDFHLAIAKISKNQLLYNMLLTTHQLMRNNSIGALVYQYDIDISHKNHKLILKAIFDKDFALLKETYFLHKKEALDRFHRNREAGFQNKPTAAAGSVNDCCGRKTEQDIIVG